MGSVDSDPGFIDLVHETARVVKQYRELLPNPILRVTIMNAEPLLQEAQPFQTLPSLSCQMI